MDQATIIGIVVIGLGALATIATAAVSIGAKITEPMKELGAGVERNTVAIVENTEQIKHLTKQQEKYEVHNSEAHKRLWDHNEKQDGKIQEHELFICSLKTKEESQNEL